MILHKENTLRAEPFYKSLSDLKLNLEESNKKSDFSQNELKLLEKYSYFIQNLISFEEEIKKDTNTKILLARFQQYLKAIIPVKDISLLFYDEFNKELLPIDEEKDSKMSKAMNHFNSEGIFQAIFNENRSITIPDLENYNSEGPKLFYLIFPVYDDKKQYGILSILTSLPDNRISELEKKSIGVFLNLVLGKLEKLRLTEKLNDTYNELQIYQAKLSNDFRLSAIGEMTEGIVEDIVDPLQVVWSNIDILGNNEENKIEVKQIRSQIKKIKTVISRLVKFADLNQKDVKIQPCNINNIIQDYFHLVKSTLDNHSPLFSFIAFYKGKYIG
jgi:transcriptional regulator with GAF, ATPase, and Fis domain